MLTLYRTRRELRFTRGGRLQPWLGPAFRGLIGRPFKRLVCEFTPAEQESTRRYCKGCPHMWGCSYGKTYEPDVPPGVTGMVGQTEAVRPLVIAPDFPAPAEVDVDDELGVNVTFIGGRAQECAGAFWEAAADAGLDPEHGLGPDHLTFEIIGEGEDDLREIVDLPMRVDSLAGVVPRLRVEFLTPLVLKSSEKRSKEPLLNPSFSDLFRAGLRTLGQLARLWDAQLPADFAGLKEASGRIVQVASEYEAFGKRRSSNRSGQANWVEGVTGSAVFADVPLSMARWMYWAGRVHVGGYRIQGAGAWDLSWAHSDEGAWEPWL